MADPLITVTPTTTQVTTQPAPSGTTPPPDQPSAPTPPAQPSLLGKPPEGADPIAALEAKYVEGLTPEQKAADTVLNPFKLDELPALIPEGMEIDGELGEKFTQLVNDYGVPRDLAGALVDLQTEAMQRASDASSQLWESTQDQWRGEVQADAEIGGPKLQAALADISRSLDEFGKDIPGLREAFDVTGAGNHPAIVKFMARMAAKLNEGRPVSGGPASGQPRSAAEILFPNQGR